MSFPLSSPARFAALVLASGALLASASAQSPAAGSPEKLRAVAGALAKQTKAFASAPPISSAAPGTAYGFEFAGLSVPRIPMTAFKGEVVLMVNTASQCGYTPQYEGLQRLQATYEGKGFSVIGVPSNDFGGQEPGSAEQIRSFCEANYGVTFPMAAKTPVTGKSAHPLYRWAAAELGPEAQPKWNFHKILIGRDGKPIAAFPSGVAPESPKLVKAIEAAIKN
jgi:glutathione peroxidase